MRLEYNSVNEFNAKIYDDIVYIIYEKIKDNAKRKEDLDELFSQSSQVLMGSVAKLYDMAVANIPTYTYTDKHGTPHSEAAFKVAPLNYKRFERDTIKESLYALYDDKERQDLLESLEKCVHKYSPDKEKWLRACKKIFYNIKPSNNSLFFLQTFMLQVKNQLMHIRNDSLSPIMLCLLSTDNIGNASGGCGKSYFIDGLKDFLKSEFGNCYYDTDHFPSAYYITPDYSKNLFAIISDAQNNAKPDFDVAGFNNIVDKRSYTRNEKYEKNSTYTSMCNLIGTSNYSFMGHNNRRFGEVTYWPINISRLIQENSPDCKYIYNLNDLPKLLHDFFYCVPDELLTTYNPMEDSQRNPRKADFLGKYNVLWDQESIDAINGASGEEALIKGTPYTSSMIARKMNTIFDDRRFSIKAADVFEKIVMKEDGSLRFKYADTRWQKDQYRTYLFEPIEFDKEDTTTSPFEKTSNWWIELIAKLCPDDPNGGNKMEEREIADSNVNLKELHLPAFSDMYAKVPNFEQSSKNQFMCVTPYKRAYIEKAINESNANISRGRDCMEPLGFVFESDSLPKDEQLNIVNDLLNSTHRGEILGAVDSGGKSIHITCILNDDYTESEKKLMTDNFKELWSDIGKYLGFEIEKMDPACANIGRLTRYPNGIRDNGNLQKAIYWNNDGRLKFDVHGWCTKKVWEQFEKSLEKPVSSVQGAIPVVTEDKRSDYEKLNACKNCSDAMKCLQDVSNGIIPSGENYYSALMAGAAIGLSREYLLQLAKSISEQHPSNIRNPEKCISDIMSKVGH